MTITFKSIDDIEITTTNGHAIPEGWLERAYEKGLTHLAQKQREFLVRDQKKKGF